ncbi:N-acetylneuraminate anomerase [Pseudoalteromonas sp.]|uniref:N-acetylneuraminate anomerase n=1 Tax=Pseudoalteromonas sp. TaxID=53249 RepID=UPI003F9CCDFF
MFLGDLSDSNSYKVLPDAFQKAIKYLDSVDLDALSIGRHDIDGENMYANVMTFETGTADSKQAEVHKEYIDMQILISGSERIEFALKDKHPHATIYDEKDDYYLVESLLCTNEVTLKPRQFAIFFPEEPHKPGCLVDKPSVLKKAVIKIHIKCLK